MNRAAGMVVGLVAALAGGWLIWQWGFCRFYVGPDTMAVVTAKSGDALPPGQILARPGQRGIQEQVLGGGEAFSQSLAVRVPDPASRRHSAWQGGRGDLQGRHRAATRRVPGEAGQKGIWRGVLGPGKYRLNPYGYQIDIVDAISIPVGYVGVVTSLSGRQTIPGAFAGPGEKGVRRDILQPGLYYVNPKALQVDLLEIGVNQVSLLGKTGGEVITKTQIASQNVAMENLQRRALAEQMEKRLDYLAQQRVQEPAADKARAESGLPAKQAAPDVPAPRSRRNRWYRRMPATC